MDQFLPLGYRWAEPKDNEAIIDGNVKGVSIPVKREGSGYGHAHLLKRLAVPNSI